MGSFFTCWSETNEPARTKEVIMLSAAITFLIIAIIAAILGFGVIAGAAAAIAKVLFVGFIILFLIFLIMGRRRV